MIRNKDSISCTTGHTEISQNVKRQKYLGQPPMDCFFVYISISFVLVIATEGSRLTFEMNSTMPLKGSNVQLSCSLSEPFNNLYIDIWKVKEKSSLVTYCFGENYNCRVNITRYNFTANSTGVFGIISHLTREDEGTWICRYNMFPNNISSWNLSVYTIPSGLSITQNPDQDVDLSENAVELHCNTIGCTYPMPTVKWMFKDQATPFENINAEISQSGTQENCNGLEMIYTSELILPQYTTFNDNSDKTGTFYCKIEYPDTSWNFISNVSHSFRFAGPPSVPSNFFFKHAEDKFLVFGLVKGLNGGHEQTFVIEHKPFGNHEANWSTVLRITERDFGKVSTNGEYYINTPKLQDGQYIFKVYAENEKGKISAIEDVYIEVKTEHPGSHPVPAITGAIIGAAVLVIIIVIVVLIVKRRSQLPTNRELNINPIYDSSNPEPLVPVYATVTKPKKPIGQNEDSNVYAQVDKSKGNKSKANKNKRHLTEDPSTSIHENSGLLKADPSTSESIYENPGNPNSSSSKIHLVDKIAFRYADLDKDPPTTKNGKPVIHGLENHTEDTEIAYGKRGEPLPDSDKEN